MGRVYRALGPDGEVALKAIKPALVADPESRQRFAREARVAAELVHPNLVGVVEAGEQDGVPYLAQRFLAGGSLAERLRRDGVPALESVLALCSEVAAGLDAVHCAGLIHRDVKPGNILFDEAGVAHLTDFGLTKDPAGTVLTRPGQALGSIDYMAPEQIKGEPVSGATDVYGLGCVVFECLVGRPPFGDRQPLRVMWAHLEDPPPDPVELGAEIPRAVADAVIGALAKSPAERPQRAPELARRVAAAAATPDR